MCKILQLNTLKFLRLFSFSKVDNVGGTVETFQRLMDQLQVFPTQMSLLWPTLAGSLFLIIFYESMGRGDSGVAEMAFLLISHRAELIESAHSHNAQNYFESSTAQILPKRRRTNIARSNTLNILYSEYLMAIHKAHNGFHSTITVSFVLFAFSSAMCF